MSEATFTIDGLREDRKPSRSGISWLAIITAVLAILFALAGGAGILVWMKAQSRADEAVRVVVADARAYRESLKTKAAPTSGRKKGRKASSKASKPAAAAAAAATAPLPEGDVPIATLREQSKTLEGKLAEYVPDGYYIVIDTANNRLYMKDGDKVVLDAKCSTGSYSKLDAPDGRSWFFHTPRGQFKVQGKIQNPIWVKPDWAFVEDNKPIPGARHPDRFEPYVMGDYALPFGNGYFIHGTLYNRLLGQSVTHGCVRLGDDDLKKVYDTVPIGTPIFIY